MDTNKLTTDLLAARSAALGAAEAVGPSGAQIGSANYDHVVLAGVRWTPDVQTAVEAAGMSGYREGRNAIGFAGPFAAGSWLCSSRTAAVEAAADLLRARGWDASVNYVLD